jgi:hypothetical protein
MDALKLTQLIVTAVQAIAQYKRTRDEMLAAGTVTHADDSVLSNKDLIALFKSDADSLTANAQALIDKYSLQQPPPSE